VQGVTMFAMNPPEEKNTKTPRDAAIHSFAVLMLHLTGRQPPPGHIENIVDSIIAASMAKEKV